MADDNTSTAGCLGRALRWSGVLAAVALLATLAAGALGAVLYQRHVVANPGPHVERDHVEAIIAQESPVYYRDGTTRIGVFFEEEHRQYVPWSDLPPAYVMSIVAAEDGRFWTHAGVDPMGIARAMVRNVKAGDIVAGGSTLTQQTAKNLYYRPDRSLKSKWQELVNALRLEAHYTKPEILTFYVNQFHVSGNGRGLGIAARYFFDKRVDELSTVESAFLAGLVKGPSHYNPFLGDEERRARSVERAHQRTRYVLRNLVDEPIENLAGPLPGRSHASDGERLAAAREVQREAARLLDEGFELQFRRGTFRYDSSAVLDEVGRRLNEAPFDEVLATAGIDDPSTAGLKVITTLDPDVQREAIYGLWHHLTEVGTMLEGRAPEDFLRADSRGPRFAPEHTPRLHEFRLAEVVEVRDPTGQPHFEVDLGGNPCVVDRDAVVRAALWVHRGDVGNRHVKVPTAKVNEFAGGIPVGGVVWVSVREVPDDGPALCDLELRPELQGAVMVIERGQVRAMVGGNDNRNFNRATALRQMGSTWKPVVYHAAIKLGWSPVDELYNQRTVFPFSTTFYYPRPDHAPEPVVSMGWAGVKSENLASIWLLYHLTDDLNSEQIRVLAESLDMARREGESETAYRARVQEMGVLPTSRRVEEGFFLQARQEVLSGLALSGHPEDALALRALLYGWGFDAERERVLRQSPGERAWKLRALDNSWVHLRDLVGPCSQQYTRLERAWRRSAIPEADEVADLTVLVDGDRIEVACGAPPSGYVTVREGLSDVLGSGETGGPDTRPTAKPSSRPTPTPKPSSRRGRLADLWPFGSGGARTALELAPRRDLLVDDRLHLATLEDLDASIRRRRLARSAAGSAAPGLYDPEVLYWHQDFRVLLGMKYVTAMAAEYGVRTELREVLSLPLGASEITLEEATTLYEGLATGQGWAYPGDTGGLTGPAFDSPAAPTLLIQEIQDVDGRVLYRATPEPTRVTPAPEADMTADILRNVIRHGTGRRAAGLLRVEGGYVPLGGKTGTTNDFRNAAFLGYVPHAAGSAWRPEGGFTVGAYVGYDDNRPMARDGIVLGGSSGALPAWMGAARGLADADLIGEPTGAPGDDGYWLLDTSRSLATWSVDTARGLPAPADAEGTATVVASEVRPDQLADLDLEVRRRIFPERYAPRTEDAEAVEERQRMLREERARRRPSIWDAP